MELPKYDPGVAANIISVIAMIVAAMSYRLTKKAETSKRDELLPDVTAAAFPMKDQEGWHRVNLTIRNNFSTDLYETGISLRKPSYITGINETQATEAKAFGARELLKIFPASAATRTISIDRRLAPAGTTRHPHGLSPGDTDWISFYVLAPTSSLTLDLVFDVGFAVRKTDIRRRDRLVSHQKIRLTPRQPD